MKTFYLIKNFLLKKIGTNKVHLKIKQKMNININHIRNKPFIVICGCTGTGKTKLSIQLAEWLISIGKKSEIINADAMQVYLFL